jgi:predicted DNA-binding transcriptional regulator AlpA
MKHHTTQVDHTTSEQLTQAFANLLDQRIDDLKKSFTPKEPEEYLTGKELDKVLKISSVTRWEWGKKGILKPRKIGNRTYYLRSEIQELLVKSNK